MKMFEAARLIGLYHNLFDFKNIDNKNKGFVAIKQLLKLQPEIHQNYSLFNTLKQRYAMDIVEIGRTSFSFVSKLTNDQTGEFLGELLLKYVLIDRNTRKATPIPLSFAEKYSKHQKKNVEFSGLGIKDAPKPPTEVFRMKAIPLHSDTDRNSHVNQSVYIRYCSDCATEAALSGVYRHFSSDMCWYPLLEMNIYHANESLANEELSVETWQDPEDFRIIFFVIKRKDTMLFRASTLFYPEKSKRRRNSRM